MEVNVEMTGFPPIPDEADFGFSTAAAAFQEAVSAIIGNAELERRIVELYGSYASGVASAAQSPEAASRAVERYTAYAGAVADAFSRSGTRTGLETAFLEYQRALQNAWAALGPDALGFEAFVIVAQQMEWVAGVLGTVRSIPPAAPN